ncbi:MAG: helix-turn-helix domain-containing protein [Polyangiaceae bacterium]
MTGLTPRPARALSSSAHDRFSSQSPRLGPPRGVLHAHPPAPNGTTHHDRVAPSAALAHSIAHFWSVQWALRAPFTAATLPHPTVHILFESQQSRRAPTAEVSGVPRARFERTLHGDGWVFGIKFRPACFHPVLGRSLHTLTGKVVPIEDLFGAPGIELGRLIASLPDTAARIDASEAFLRPRLERPPVEIARVRDLVERISEDRTLVRVEDVARIARVDVRTLQRQFQRFVGVTPKWVLARYRLHEAAERLKAPSPPSLADLALALGYSDQAHFARDFKRVVGASPSAYIQSVHAAPVSAGSTAAARAPSRSASSPRTRA